MFHPPYSPPNFALLVYLFKLFNVATLRPSIPKIFIIENNLIPEIDSNKVF